MVKSLEEFYKIHDGQKIIVCGCGTSLSDFLPYHSDYITIGVNDVPRLFDPTYLVVTDHMTRFEGKRKDYVMESKAKHLFTCVKGWRHPHLVFFELGSRALKNLDSPNKVDHFLNSPYVAVNIAYKMGAKHIGLIGVDFTSGHFYNKNDGAHPIVKISQFTQVNSAYQVLRNELNNRGVGLYNLSEISTLEIPKMTLGEFNLL